MRMILFLCFGEARAEEKGDGLLRLRGGKRGYNHLRGRFVC